MRAVESELDGAKLRMPNPWSLVKLPEEFWGDLSAHGRRLLKELLDGTMESCRDAWVQVDWHVPDVERSDHRSGYFCRRLLRQRRRRVFLIVDGHPVHRSAAARDWLHAHRHRIRVFFLPGYSPELNPDEYLNNDVKSNAVGRQRPATKPELIANLQGCHRDTQRRPNIIRNYFHAGPVRYAAG